MCLFYNKKIVSSIEECLGTLYNIYNNIEKHFKQITLQHFNS